MHFTSAVNLTAQLQNTVEKSQKDGPKQKEQAQVVPQYGSDYLCAALRLLRRPPALAGGEALPTSGSAWGTPDSLVAPWVCGCGTWTWCDRAVCYGCRNTPPKWV